MKHAQVAIKQRPKRVEGHYFHAWAVGQWSLGISIPKALWKGAEGQLRKSMKNAEKLDRSYDYFGVLRMWGRFYHSLPWPKYDGPKALKYFLSFFTYRRSGGFLLPLKASGFCVPAGQ